MSKYDVVCSIQKAIDAGLINKDPWQNLASKIVGLTYYKGRILRPYKDASATKYIIGGVFNTEAEQGCIGLSEPDANGDFTGLNSGGIECRFNVAMIRS